MKQSLKIFDYHIHTQYAYCSQNEMLPESSIKIAKEKSYGICLLEHAGQLYVKSEDFWNQNIVNKPEIFYDDETSRMDEYITYMSKYRDKGILLGLELDLNCNGILTVREEHLHAFDMFLGAVHYIPKKFNNIDKGFLWNIDVFGENKLDILAHPFRIYKRLKLPKPTHLYKKVAMSLSKYKIAAEINYHTNEPDLEFFRLCIDNGVKIAFGSDAHKLEEVGSFERNFDLLNKIYNGNIEDILYNHEKKELK